MIENWYEIDDVAELDSPALVVFPERVKQNIRIAISMIADITRLRPHIKTIKSKEVVQLMIQEGISKFKCATIAEAEMLAQCKAKDILLAYQLLGPKLKRFVLLIQKYPNNKFACLVDNITAAEEQSMAFSSAGLAVDIFIDLNVGMNRTGIEPTEKAVNLYKFCHSLPGIKIAGLHVYDGHLRDTDLEQRIQKCDAAFTEVMSVKNSLIKEGLNIPVIVAGGSPTFPIHCKRKDIDCSPGTFVYWDKGYSELCPEQKFQTAAVLVTRVVSLPRTGYLCLDLGHKSVAAENEITRRVFFLNAPGLTAISQSEEHLVVKADEDHSFKVGHVLYGIPVHICPTVALYEKVYTVENRKVTGNWKNVARDRMISI